MKPVARLKTERTLISSIAVLRGSGEWARQGGLYPSPGGAYFLCRGEGVIRLSYMDNHPPDPPRRVFMHTFALSLVVAVTAAQPAPASAEAGDEQALAALHLGADGPALLDF